MIVGHFFPPVVYLASCRFTSATELLDLSASNISHSQSLLFPPDSPIMCILSLFIDSSKLLRLWVFKRF